MVNPAAVELGKLGGVKGGKARAAALSPERRKEISQQAAMARWHPIDREHLINILYGRLEQDKSERVDLSRYTIRKIIRVLEMR